MWKQIGNFLTGGGLSSIENIASEWIETSKEEAEAKSIMVKTLDPNGKMRRDQSRNVGGLYRFYLIFTSLMILVELIYSMWMGADLVSTDHVLVALSNATTKMTDLFVPISTLYGIITTASFGVNYANTKKNK